MIFPGSALKELILSLREYSAFYQQHFAQCMIDWAKLDEYDEFRLLPYLGGRHIHQQSSTFRLPGVQITRIYCSGGTSGEPKSIYYTNNDWRSSVDANVKCLKMAGVVPGDVVAILQPFGIWSIGSVFLDSVTQLGAVALPLGIHLSDADVQRLLWKHNATVLMAAPGNICRLTAEILKQGQLPSAKFPVRKLILSGEKYSVNQQSYLAKNWQSTVISLYGSAETDSLAIECPACQTHQLLTEDFFFELLTHNGPQLLALNPETAITGELVVTTLHKQGTPLVRYRLGDIVQVIPGCKYCRGTFAPNIRIIGRSTPAISLIEGTKLYSYQIERAIEQALGMPFCCQVTITQEHGKDALYFVIFCEEMQPEQESRIKEHLINASIDFSDAMRAGAVARIEVECRNLSELQPNQRGKIVAFRDNRPNDF